MALNYLKEGTFDFDHETPTASFRKKPLSKKKFLVLLVMNLTLWLSVSGFYLEISPASMKESLHEFSKRRGVVVSGVVCNSKMQAAIISDEIYEVGDMVKGYRIINIKNDGVELKKGRKQVFKKVVSLK
ncbi:MAG: hypothetical protein H8E62_06410 [Planctomycetes bacterium]|nr:hypothetical protein [Planctomycetota bacterium]